MPEMQIEVEDFTDDDRIPVVIMPMASEVYQAGIRKIEIHPKPEPSESPNHIEIKFWTASQNLDAAIAVGGRVSAHLKAVGLHAEVKCESLLPPRVGAASEVVERPHSVAAMQPEKTYHLRRPSGGFRIRVIESSEPPLPN